MALVEKSSGVNMKKNSHTAVIILALFVVILACAIAISLFYLSQESQGRKEAETSLADARDRNMKIEAALKEAQENIDVLKGKNKDADEKINNLMQELDLEKNLKEQAKTENKKFKDALEEEAKSKVDMRQKMTAQLEAIQASLKQAEEKLRSQTDNTTGLQQKVDELQKKNDDLEKKVKDFEQAAATATAAAASAKRDPLERKVPARVNQDRVSLDRIVVTPDSAPEGRVLNVDSETEFLIFDLGAKNNVKEGDVMSVYRGKTYLGDVKASRVQEEMSAADFIPPLTSHKVRKGDQVVPKR
ncbi:MAG: hypothetical protein HQL18_03680 [Candidatus Omnitrophica bacterium]|nr:hypothetical protein [Candidatus Omnitrophota bacterium]